jgi:copper homeostasis protein
VKYEVCVDSVDGVLAAQRVGAHRVELCSGLFDGGLTPSIGLVETALAAVDGIGVYVIIRPRGGDFVYDVHEVAAMERDIGAIRAAGAPGIVIGALTPDGDIDRPVIERLIQAADGLPTTFHRAFDMTKGPHTALEALVSLGVDRILTSGQEATALEGTPLIAELVAQAGERIVIMAGGGVNERTAPRIVAATNVQELHFSAFAEAPSPALHRNPRPNLGGVLRRPEYTRQLTSADRIAAIMSATRC